MRERVWVNYCVQNNLLTVGTTSFIRDKGDVRGRQADLFNPLPEG